MNILQTYYLVPPANEVERKCKQELEDMGMTVSKPETWGRVDFTPSTIDYYIEWIEDGVTRGTEIATIHGDYFNVSATIEEVRRFILSDNNIYLN